MSPTINQYLGFYEADEGAPLFRTVGEAIDWLCPEYRDEVLLDFQDSHEYVELVASVDASFEEGYTKGYDTGFDDADISEENAYNRGYADAVNEDGLEIWFCTECGQVVPEQDAQKDYHADSYGSDTPGYCTHRPQYGRFLTK